ncbi:MAG: class I SAM-dependent methyltransferase [Deltaproteobacteria bacterium]|nr:class I SAM-dependent methyltransferase [Deltaproteobacteria bacterium]
MKLSPTHIQRFENFLDLIKTHTYPEALTDLHSNLTQRMLEYFLAKCPLESTSKILDVGCGQGVALQWFMRKGFHPIGITLNQEDIAACRNKGYDVIEMDQSFMDFDDKTFDLIWCRHCIEHSVFPYFTLHEFNRVLRQRGYLYIEVPAPDTSCKHQTNMNHYSVLGKNMWASLMIRAGFTVLEDIDISFKVQAGPDVYFAFILQKK